MKICRGFFRKGIPEDNCCGFFENDRGAAGRIAIMAIKRHFPCPLYRWIHRPAYLFIRRAGLHQAKHLRARLRVKQRPPRQGDACWLARCHGRFFARGPFGIREAMSRHRGGQAAAAPCPAAAQWPTYAIQFIRVCEPCRWLACHVH
jgi:hypothetical protein